MSSGNMATVVFAFAANVAVAAAKSLAAVVTGSASMLAEAVHSWADAGNEVFLVFAERRSTRSADRDHPYGYGRAAYTWSMFAAFGLFSVGAAVSVMHGIQQLGAYAAAEDYGIAYVVLAIAFVLEGTSFLQSVRQARRGGARLRMRTLAYINRTSSPTLRAVFAEDSTALIGLLLAATGMLLHQITGQAVFDALGSIAVGVLLGVVAIFLIRRNAEFILGQQVPERTRTQVLRRLLTHPQVERVTSLHAEYVGPERIAVVATVDIVGDLPEHLLAERLQEVEDAVREQENVAAIVLSLARAHEPGLEL